MKSSFIGIKLILLVTGWGLITPPPPAHLFLAPWPLKSCFRGLLPAKPADFWLSGTLKMPVYCCSLKWTDPSSKCGTSHFWFRNHLKLYGELFWPQLTAEADFCPVPLSNHQLLGSKSVILEASYRYFYTLRSKKWRFGHLFLPKPSTLFCTHEIWS